MAENSRQIAFEILNKIETDDSFSNIMLNNYLKKIESSVDKAFISRLVYGVVERKLTLDYIIGKFCKKYTSSKKVVKTALRMGVYQIYFFDNIPERAAVNETVNLLNNKKYSYYKSFVNAVLRNICQNKIDIDSLPEEYRYSCPIHLINLWKKAYGEENTINILEAINEKAPIYLTPNTLKISAEELCNLLNKNGKIAKKVGNSVQILSQLDIAESELYKKGLFFVQDISSKCAADLLNAKNGDTVLDMCCCPGGKSFETALNMKNEGQIYAFDIHENKLSLVNDGAKRLGINIIKTKVNDASVFNKDMPLADKIICDVPCSGFGIIRRKPEIKYKNLDEIKPLYDIQYQILSTCSKYLKTGGQLVYSTCTLNKNENEKIVSKFLKENENFECIEQSTVFPSKNGGDGFFMALIRKEYD